MLGQSLGEATEEGIDQLAQAFLNQKPDTNLAEAWNNAVEAAKVGGALGASTNTVSSAIEKGHAVEPGGAVTNSWRTLPMAFSKSESAAAPSVQGANGPNGLAARFAQEWGLKAQSPAPQGAQRNAIGEPATPAPRPVEHPVATGGVVGGAEGSYAGPSTPSSPLVSSANPTARGEGEVSPTNGNPASGAASPANEGTRPSVAASQPAVNVTASPTPVSSPQSDVVMNGQAPAAVPSITAPPADTKTGTSAPKSNKRLNKEQQSEVKALGNIRTRIEGLRKQSQRSELRESHRAAIERELPYYLAKEAEFAAKVEAHANERPQLDEEIPALAEVAAGNTAESMLDAVGSGKSTEWGRFGAPSQSPPVSMEQGGRSVSPHSTPPAQQDSSLGTPGTPSTQAPSLPKKNTSSPAQRASVAEGTTSYPLERPSYPKDAQAPLSDAAMPPVDDPLSKGPSIHKEANAETSSPLYTETHPSPLAGSIRNINPNYPAEGYNKNCVECVIATEKRFAGYIESTANSTSGPQPISSITGKLGGSFLKVSGMIEIGNILRKHGNGSRGIVYGADKSRGYGHVWNVRFDHGVVRFLDSQPADNAGLGVHNFDHFTDFQFLLTSTPSTLEAQ